MFGPYVDIIMYYMFGPYVDIIMYYMFGPYVDIIMYSHFIKVRRKLCISFIHTLNLLVNSNRRTPFLNIQTEKLYLVDGQCEYWLMFTEKMMIS